MKKNSSGQKRKSGTDKNPKQPSPSKGSNYKPKGKVNG